MSNPPAQTLASHLIQQIRSSLAILEQLDVVQPQDADTIRSKLPPPHGPFPSLQTPLLQRSPTMTSSFNQMSIAATSPDKPPAAMAAPPAPPSLPSRGPSENRAKALWDYTGNESDDLRFRAGDTIIIDEEVNDQWYRGRVIPQGEQYPRDHRGLFPSNYVERMQPYYKSPPPPQSMAPYQPPPPPVYYENDSKPAYQMQPQVVVQEQQQGHNRFGKLGSSMANGAAGGFGFGAGAAIAGDLVNKIF